MDTLALLEAVRSGKVAPEEALLKLKMAPFVDLGYAKADLHRQLRQGAPEVVYGAGKTPEQAAAIAAALRDEGGAECVLITRADPAMGAAVAARFPDAVYHEQARICVVGRPPAPGPHSLVCVVTAGTSDIPVAEEAAVTAEALGSRVERVYDVGVSGLQRLLSKAELLMQARALVVAAGMEGALPSVVGGLVDAPVLAVPTSVGYGASFGGVTALLSMMNSCSANVSTVNIDNGFGAGYLASMIDRRCA